MNQLKTAVFFFFLGLIGVLADRSLYGWDGKPHELKRFEISQPLMGVKFRFVVYAKDREKAVQVLSDAFKRVRELNGILSDYDSQSEIRQVSENAKVGVPIKVSPDLIRVLQISQEVVRESDGAFDPSIGRLTELWRRARKEMRLPTQTEIDSARSLSGWQQLEINGKAKTVTLSRQGIRLDFGGVAKGYAADEAIRVFNRHGVTSAMVDAGGDITVSDPPPGKKGWSIAVAGDKKSILTLVNGSVATSGDRFQYLTYGGKKYSHIVDPKTGLGTTHQNQVTVVCLRKEFPGAYADAFASAFSVLKKKSASAKLNQSSELFLRIQHRPQVQIQSGKIILESKNFRSLLSEK